MLYMLKNACYIIKFKLLRINFIIMANNDENNNVTVRIVSSGWNGQTLQYQGHEYFLGKDTPTVTYWQCRYHRIKSCPG